MTSRCPQSTLGVIKRPWKLLVSLWTKRVFTSWRKKIAVTSSKFRTWSSSLQWTIQAAVLMTFLTASSANSSHSTWQILQTSPSQTFTAKFLEYLWKRNMHKMPAKWSIPSLRQPSQSGGILPQSCSRLPQSSTTRSTFVNSLVYSKASLESLRLTTTKLFRTRARGRTSPRPSSSW